MARKKTVKKAKVAKPKISTTMRAEPKISKDPNEPWHEVKERYGNTLKPKFQVIEGATNRKGE